MKGSAAARPPERGARTGARVSAALQRWPARNYFADLQPRLKEVNPIDELMDGHPEVRRIRRRVRRFLTRVQKHARADDLLDFEAERNLLDWTRVEAAYNLGFEGGLVLGPKPWVEPRGARAIGTNGCCSASCGPPSRARASRPGESRRCSSNSPGRSRSAAARQAGPR